MKKIYYSFLFLFILSPVGAAQSLLFKNTLVPEAPPTAKVMAAYMEIKNLTDKNIILNQFSSSDFESVELHRTTIKDNIAKMIPQKLFTVPAKKSITLQQGGLHLMLKGPKKTFKKGDLVQLEIIEANKTKHIIEVMIKKPGHAHHHH